MQAWYSDGSFNADKLHRINIYVQKQFNKTKHSVHKLYKQESNSVDSNRLANGADRRG